MVRVIKWEEPFQILTLRKFNSPIDLTRFSYLCTVDTGQISCPKQIALPA